MDDDEQWRDWDDGLDILIVDYFKTIFTASSVDNAKVLDVIIASVSDVQNETLV